MNGIVHGGKIKKGSALLAMLLAAILFVLGGCKNSESISELSDDDRFNFMSYEGKSGISNIKEIELDGTLSDRCRTYKFDYKSDDFSVVGFISVPADCLKNRRAEKCIIFNRGGNCNMGLLEDSDTAAICAQTGRIILATQYRGSEGCTGYDEFGGDDINDVLSLIDICGELSFADMSDLCVGGVSRGGMMSYMAARLDKRVKKVVAVSAVTDLKASYGEREDMKEILDTFIGGTPDELPTEYEKRSAVCWADELNVPVLIIHSRDDKMVSYSQAEEMAKTLKKYKKKYDFVSYDDSVHGLHKEDGEVIRKWLEQSSL